MSDKIKLDLREVSDLLNVNFDVLKYYLILKNINVKFNKAKILTQEDFIKIICVIYKGIENEFKIDLKLLIHKINKSILENISKLDNHIQSNLMKLTKLQKEKNELNSLLDTRKKNVELIKNIELKYSKNLSFLKLDTHYKELKLKNVILNTKIEIFDDSYFNQQTIEINEKNDVLLIERIELEKQSKQNQDDLISFFNQNSSNFIDFENKQNVLKSFAEKLCPKVKIPYEGIKKKYNKTKKEIKQVNSDVKESKNNNGYFPGKYFPGKEFYDSTQSSLRAILIPTGGKNK